MAGVAPVLGPLVPQEPEWLWQALWQFIGEEGHVGDSFVLNIPDTVLLDAQGLPERWLGVSRTGVVIRKRFPRNKTGRKVSDATAPHKLANHVHDCMWVASRQRVRAGCVSGELPWEAP